MQVTPIVAETEALTSLKGFFEAWQLLARPSEPAHVPQPPDPVRLEQFCEAFQPVFAKLQREGEFVDVWSVAGLNSNELRHASVLAWFLDPNESHGFGQEIFRAWMASLKFPGECRLEKPSLWHPPYRVATEVLQGDGANRFDIEISGKHFYLCVEVKINAPEGANQLNRYLVVAEKRAGDRPFSVVYLSRNEPKKLSSDSKNVVSTNVVSTSWASFAAAVRKRPRQSSQSNRNLSDRLLDQFLNRVEKL
jgi:PD-(D/E)XK nuclease superfamily